MRNQYPKHLGRAARAMFGPMVWPMLVLVLAANSVLANAVVKTLTGGPSAANPAFFGYADGDTAALAQFHTPVGLALDTTGNMLLVADRDNNAIRLLDLGANQTFTFEIDATNLLSKPVGVAIDSDNNVYVLNHGNGSNGSLYTFNNFGEPTATNATSLMNANGLAIDGSRNIYATINNNTIIQISPLGVRSTVAIITNAGTVLQGLTVLAEGPLAVCDSGRNGILLVDPVSGNNGPLTGFNGAGDVFGTASHAKFRQPFGVAETGDGRLVVTDNGNHRVKTVDFSGNVTPLYAVNSSFWVTGSGTFPGWWDGTNCSADTFGCVEARLPAGVVVAPDGSAYTSEDYYHLIRHVSGTGFASPGGGTGTNVVVPAPLISPSSGYYPMGQNISVSSPNPNVFYTTDGTDPTTNSTRVNMSGNVGTIHWSSTTNDLTGLRVKAFVGTNASPTVSGQPVTANSIGIPPAPAPGGVLMAGIGSTIVVPVVTNLRTNDQVKSYQFRVEVTPIGAALPITGDYDALNMLVTNDFLELATPVQSANGSGSTIGIFSVSHYTIGSTVGLEITAIGTNSGVFFKFFATTALLKVPLPYNANVGDTYSVTVLYPSATSDGFSAPVYLTPMSSATILVTNVAYTVGDSASATRAWYNAGTFGDSDLQNSDVNLAFYAALGLRVPYAFSDVFNAMDAYPLDAPGFAGGDGQIRFLDWQVILQRSLRLDTNNWTRAWSAGGNLVNASTALIPAGPMLREPRPATLATWYRQALLGAVSVGNVIPGSQVNVPVYVKMGDQSTLAGLQFRAIVTPVNGGPALTVAPQLAVSPTMAFPSEQQSVQADSTAFGWNLGTFSFASRSSNFVGWLKFTMPATAVAGQTYAVSFANADGAPNISTEYNFETRSASVAVNTAAVPASICSDEWKIQYFGSLTNPNAADNADPDADGFPNWMDYLAATDPTDYTSKLKFTGVEKAVMSGQKQVLLHWQTAQGKAYEIQWSASPVGGSWNVLGNLSGDGTVASFADTAPTAAPRYYRLRILQ